MEMFWLMLVSILLAALFAGAETGVYVFKSHRLDRRSRAGRFIADFLQRKESLVALCLVAHNLFLFIATLCFDGMLDSFGAGGGLRLVLDVLIFAPVMFLVGDVYPKGIFRIHADTLMPRLIGVFVLFKTLLLPIYAVIQLLIRFMSWMFRGEGSDLNVTPQHIHWLIQDQSPSSADTSKIVSRIMGLRDLPVSTLMEPLSRVKCVDAAMPSQEVRRLFLEGSEERLLVSESARPGVIVGLITLNKALLSEGGDARSMSTQIPTLMHKSSIHDALQTLKDAASPVCRVQASNGMTMGILYTRRIVSEIVGDGGIW